MDVEHRGAATPTATGPPVLAALAETAARLVRATEVLVYRREGDRLRLVARHGSSRGGKAIGDVHPIDRRTALGRAVLDRRPVRVGTAVALPMLRGGTPAGVIVARRPKGRAFSSEQIGAPEGLAGLAAAVAQDLDARGRELTETLEQQTATGEILRVISGSPTDVQPVFETIARSARQLCEAQFCQLFRFDGELLHFVAHDGLTPEGVEAVQRGYPIAPGRTSAAARAVLSGAVEHIADVHGD